MTTSSDQTQKALDLLSVLVLEDGRRWAEAATRVQLDDARAILTTEGAPRRHWVSRARGYAKTSDLAAISIAVMLTQLAAGARMYAAAADQDQAKLLLDSIRGFVLRTPELAGLLTIEADRVVASNGVTLEMLASDSASSYGLRPAFLIIDELCQWPNTTNAKEFYAAITTALPKVAGSRLVIITTAGDPTHWSRQVFDHACEERLWRVNETSGPAPWMSVDEIEAERRRLPDPVFRRLFQNEWCAANDRLVRPDDLEACVVLDGPLPPRQGVRYVLGLDIGITNDRTAAAICHAEPIHREGERRPVGSRVVLDRMMVWEGTKQNPVLLAEVEASIERMWRAYGHPRIVCDPYQAASIMQRLQGLGVKVEQFNFTASSVSRLALTMNSLVNDRNLALPRDPELLDELSRVRLKETSPSCFRIDHDAGQHDDRVIAIALAANDLIEKGVKSRPGRIGIYTWTQYESFTKVDQLL